MAIFYLIALSMMVYYSSASIIGVPLEKLSFYDKGKDFSCLDGSQSIPFSYVNDDYCDCIDGTDEPGTSACTNSMFYCENKEYEPQYLLSSRVNDGICDCCDGTDEWNTDTSCPNTCVELGKRVKEEMRRLQEVEEEGFRKRSEYMAHGQQKKEEYEKDLSELESNLGVIVSEVDALRQAKEDAEEPEAKKKEEHQQRWEEEKTVREAERRKAKAQKAFSLLDSDSNGEVSIEEVIARTELDDNGDNVVSVEEAETYLDGNQPVDFEVFLEKSWDVMSGKFKEAAEKEEPDEGREPEDKQEEEIEEEEGEEDDDDDDDDDENLEEEDSLEMPPYDEETKQLIEVADEARKVFKEAEERKKDVESRKNDVEKYLNMDLGPGHEFSPLFEQCYEYTDREYTYKLCIFHKVTQRSKNGGRETSLGTWENWSGPSDNKYSVMRYGKGEKCWNGPDRSTTIYLKCGVEDKLISASEPNKCEYAMDFTTPALCEGKVKNKKTLHVEL